MRRLLVTILSFAFLTVFSHPAAVNAQTAWSSQPNGARCTVSHYLKNGPVSKLNGVADAAKNTPSIQGLECLFYNILQVIVYFAGLAFLIMFIYGGFQYLFMGDDPKKAAVAQSTLTLSFMGLIGVIFSFLIIKFIQNFTGVNVMDFAIPGP